jgi:hypothetical protein
MFNRVSTLLRSGVSIEATSSSLLDRRRLLFGLAAASTAAAIPATASTPPEDPELINLGDMLPAILDEHRAATDAESAIVKTWAPRWPRAPEILHDGAAWGMDMERDLIGRGISHTDSLGKARFLRLHKATDVATSIEHATKALRRRRNEASRQSAMNSIEHWTPIHDAAREYEAECQHIRDRSGYEAAHERRLASEKALTDHVFLILRQEPQTMAGIVIQAQAIEAARHIDRLSLMLAEAQGGDTCGKLLAANLLRIARGDAEITHANI